MSNIQINTTQNVNISIRLASLGERLLASLIDFIIMAAYVYVAGRIIDAMNLLDYTRDRWIVVAIISLFFLPVLLYTLLSEIFFNGQTLGKKVMKIKVIKIDGYRAGFGDFFTRWIFRIVDIWLVTFTPIVGIVSIIVSKNNQRIGDMASGTAVISIKDRYKINHEILEETQRESYKPTYPEVIKFSDNDMRIIRETYHAALQSNDRKTMEKLRIKVEEITGTSKNDLSDSEYINRIIKDYVHYTQNM